MSYCFGEGCPHPDHGIGGYVTAPPVNESRTCNKSFHYKNDGDSNPVILECNRLHGHRGAHRGKYTGETIRWK